MTDIPDDVMQAAREATVKMPRYFISYDERGEQRHAFGDFVHYSDALDYLAYALLADREKRVLVKPLEWWVSDTGDIIADSIVGRYRLGKVTANTRFRLETPSGLLERRDYWEEAEAYAAAQADYERRIKATLEFTDEPESFQSRVAPWMQECFGPEVSADKLERGDRFLEEALELLQSGGYPHERVARLSSYVYSRPAGEPAQEVGGVMVTLAAYCLAHELDMHVAGETELARVWTKVEAIRAKQAAKPRGSALPITDDPDPRLAAAEADAERLAEAATTVVCQTSAKHHPGYVVVRPEGFKALRAALASHENRKGERHE